MIGRIGDQGIQGDGRIRELGDQRDRGEGVGMKTPQAAELDE